MLLNTQQYSLFSRHCRQHRYQSVSVSYFLLHLSIYFASDIQ